MRTGNTGANALKLQQTSLPQRQNSQNNLTKIDPQLLLAAHTHFQGLPKATNLFFALVFLFLSACNLPAQASTSTPTNTPTAITVTVTPPPSLTPTVTAVPATQTPGPATGYTLAEREAQFIENFGEVLRILPAVDQEALTVFAPILKFAMAVDPTFWSSFHLAEQQRLQSLYEAANALPSSTIDDVRTQFRLTGNPTDSAILELPVQTQGIHLDQSSDYTSTLSIPFEQDIQLANPDNIAIVGQRINPQTLEAQWVSIPVTQVRLNGRTLEIRSSVPIICEDRVLLNQGAISTGSGQPVAQAIHIPIGMTATDEVTSQLYFRVSQEGRQYMSQRSYGAPAPQYLPGLPASVVNDPVAYADAMQEELNVRVDRAVELGDVTQAYADEVKAHFDDPAVIAKIPDPFLRFALVLGDLTNSNHAGINSLLGRDGYPGWIGVFYRDDPQLTRLIPTIEQDIEPFTDRTIGTVNHRTTGQSVFILNPAIRGAKEVPEYLAALVLHEFIIHQTFGRSPGEPPVSGITSHNSLPEETMGNLVELISLIQLARYAPEGDAVFHHNTWRSQVVNPMLLMLANSGEGRNPGILGDGSGRYVLPESLSNSQLTSFLAAMELSYGAHLENQGPPVPTDVSSGSRNLDPLLRWLLGPNVLIPASLDKNGDGVTDFSPELLQFVHDNLGNSPVLSAPEILRLAQALRWNIQQQPYADQLFIYGNNPNTNLAGLLFAMPWALGSVGTPGARSAKAKPRKKTSGTKPTPRSVASSIKPPRTDLANGKGFSADSKVHDKRHLIRQNGPHFGSALVQGQGTSLNIMG